MTACLSRDARQRPSRLGILVLALILHLVLHNRRNSMKKVVIVLLLLAAGPVAAQTTCTPRYGGGTNCYNAATGESTTTTPRYGGGTNTYNNQTGSTTTTTPRYGGGYNSYDNQTGSSTTTTPSAPTICCTLRFIAHKVIQASNDQVHRARCRRPSFGMNQRSAASAPVQPLVGQPVLREPEITRVVGYPRCQRSQTLRHRPSPCHAVVADTQRCGPCAAAAPR